MVSPGRAAGPGRGLRRPVRVPDSGGTGSVARSNHAGPGPSPGYRRSDRHGPAVSQHWHGELETHGLPGPGRLSGQSAPAARIAAAGPVGAGIRVMIADGRWARPGPPRGRRAARPA